MALAALYIASAGGGSSKATASSDWMSNCLSGQHGYRMGDVPATHSPSIGLAAATATARASHAMLASSPTTGRLVQLVPAHSAGAQAGGVIDNATLQPVWAVGFSGLHQSWGAGLPVPGVSPTTRVITGWIVLVDTRTGAAVLGLGCW